jgi:flagellar hook assembly protein FlgD
MPVQLMVTIYNSAGERVRQLFVGNVQYVAQDLSLDQSAMVPGDEPNGTPLNPVTLDLKGAQSAGTGTLTWDGTNDGGQPVASGVYTWHVEYKLPDDRVVSQNLSVQALSAPSEQRIEIFNSAGERVYQESLSPFGASGGFRLDDPQMVAGADQNGAPQGGLKLMIQTASGDQPWTWSGKNDQGAWVNSGTYTVQLIQAWPDGRTQTLVKSFTVLRVPDLDRPGGDLLLGPSPLRAGQPLTLFFSPAAGFTVELRLYDLAGEAVGFVGGDAGSGQLKYDAERLASGIYLGQVRFLQGNAVARVQGMKISVVH